MSENDEVVKESKKLHVFPSRRGTSFGVNVPPELVKAFSSDKSTRQFLVKIQVLRGTDGKRYLAIRRVKIE